VLRTVFDIPVQVGGVSVFGFGLLLALWVVFSAGLLTYLVRKRGFDSETRGYLPLLLFVAIVIAFVLPALIGPDGLPIRGYGTMLVVAVCAASFLGARRARQMGLDADLILSMSFWVFLAGVVGARVFYIVQYWDQFRRDTWSGTLSELANIAQGGLVVYGGVIGGVAALLIFLRIHRLPTLAICDLIAPVAALGLALGRMGCFLNGCCYGGVADVPWAVQFPIGSPPFVDQLENEQIYLHGIRLIESSSGQVWVDAVEPGSDAERAGMRVRDMVHSINGVPIENRYQAYSILFRADHAGDEISIVSGAASQPRQWTVLRASRSLKVHPTQLYSAINGLVLFFFLWSYYPFRRRDGEVIAMLMTIYPITRFVLEMIRTDESAIGGTGLTISQNVSVGLFLAALVLWGVLLRQPRGSRLVPQVAHS
jgi:phosphatidylglycerol:prolipoprotein diacylglycerol transferase